MVDVGVGHRHLRSQLGIGACPDRLVGGQAVGDARQALLDTVVCSADQIDLAELRVDLQQQIVPVEFLDLPSKGQQQLLRRNLVGGEYQPTGALQVADNRHS